MKRTAYALAIISIAIIIYSCLISITLQPIGDETSWLDTDFRQMDIADNLYSVAYQESFTYGEPEMPVVTFTYNNEANTFQGTLAATGLKPNFAYQMKLVGKPGLDDWGNEQIGYAGRWWRKQPNPGNSNDTEYEDNKGNPDYIFEGYLLFDFLVTDEIGNVSINFTADSSYHVLWATHESTGDGAGHRDPGPNDSDELYYQFTASPVTNPDAYDQEYQPGEGATVGVYAEWEPGRALQGELTLPAGDYKCKFILTEESFHSPPGSPGGYWAGAMQGNVNFTITSAGKKEKVEICHIIAENDVIPFGPAPVMLYFGEVESIAEYNAHEEHGDSTAFWGPDTVPSATGPINMFREAGAHLPAANCYFGIAPDGSIRPPQ